MPISTSDFTCIVLFLGMALQVYPQILLIFSFFLEIKVSNILTITVFNISPFLQMYNTSFVSSCLPL